MYFYPRSPCGERRSLTVFLTLKRLFLSTLSLRRATLIVKARFHAEKHFYPRSPCGERRNTTVQHIAKFKFLSTLSLRRATHNTDWHGCHRPDFYPRSPCGERRKNGVYCDTDSVISIHALLAESDPAKRMEPSSTCTFLSTLSLRRATS